MAMHKLEAILLQRQEVRETSLLVTAFSRDLGKIRGLVKGVRGGRAAVPWFLEPMTLQTLVFYERRRSSVGLIGSFDLLDGFDPIRRDLNRLAYASMCLDLVDSMTEIGDPHPEIFVLLLNVLKAIAEGADPPSAVRFFEAQLLRECGLLPSVERVGLSSPAQEVLHQILERSSTEIKEFHLSPEIEQQLRLRFQRFFHEALHRELKSRRFLQALGLERSAGVLNGQTA